MKKKIKYPYNSDKNCASCSKNFPVDERCQISIVNFRKKFVNFSGKNEETYLSEEILGYFCIDFNCSSLVGMFLVTKNFKK